ncbi:MAG: manganese efflux pump MntP family protein [Bacillota bacterium]
MAIYDIILMGIALGTDAFSVAMVIGSREFKHNHILQLSGITGLLHIFMPLAGLFGGQFIKRLVEALFSTSGHLDYLFDVIGAGMLMLIGFYMIIEPLLGREDEIKKFKICFSGMCFIAFSVSLDSFAVGVSLGLINFTILFILIIGLMAFLMMGTGLYLGSVLDYHLPINTQLWGGVALVLLGLRFMGVI